jgi:hypothetical protein
LPIAHYAALFFGGAFAMNAVPHLVAGAMGRPLQSPFATPPGQGLSSSPVNVLWGFANAVVAWLLLARGATFDAGQGDQALAAGLGAFAIALHLALHFGRFNGGNLKGPTPR